MEQMDFSSSGTRVRELEAEDPVVAGALGELMDAAALERRLCELAGASHCVSVPDAAAGVALALRAAGVGAGDRVLCTALATHAAVRGIHMAGALPLTCDLNPNTYTVDPYCLEYALGKLQRFEQPPPRALVASDLFGMPCDWASLEPLCREHGLVLIEDMGSAFGARVQDRFAGSFGRFSAASLQGLDEGGGGALFCRDDADEERVRALCGPDAQQMLDMESAAAHFVQGSVFSARIDGATAEQALVQSAAERYRRRLDGRVRLQRHTPGATSAYRQMVAALPAPGVREDVLRALSAKGIPCTVPALALSGEENPWDSVMLINTRSVAARLIALPMHAHLSEHVIDFICESLLEAVGF